MRLGVITDEVSQDFKEALDFAKKFELDCVELRSAWEKGPFDYNNDDIKRLKSLSDEYGIAITAISSPMFKCEYSMENIAKQEECFKKLIEYSCVLGASKIRCFDFLKNGNVTRDMILEAYQKPYELCEKTGITIAIESEPTTNSSCCKDIAELVNLFNKPYFKALYDPGNNIYCSEEVPYPDGFEFIKNIFCHIHIKDAVQTSNGAVGECVGKGMVDYQGIFKRLYAIGYEGDVMLETHYRIPGTEKIDDETLANPKGSAISENGYEASCVCMTGLKELIKMSIK
ncbi:MAG: sugar phosphate isomerase/epimerase [Clostridia bacterium]|nr:sugar phosphate isomerase/epimerase [Clostridia bacterium]